MIYSDLSASNSPKTLYEAGVEGLTSFWCSAEQKYKSIPACEQALQRIVEGAPHTQHFFSDAWELMARDESALGCKLMRRCRGESKRERSTKMAV